MAGIYIHVPFCKRKCSYCNFYSVARSDIRADYLAAVERELCLRRNYLQGEPVKTIYFGGGTPSLLQPSEIQAIIDSIKQKFEVEADAEITVEANPDDLTESYVDKLAKTDTNRLSIGIQSFNDAMLQFMNRRHSAQQAIDAVHRCQEAGFKNISIDLIYGLPGMQNNQWRQQLVEAEKLNVQHLSAYHLTFEEGTAFGLKLKQKKILEIAEEESLAQFDVLTDWAKAAGFEHYEISNFARPGFQSRHNSSYWDRTIYLGVGPAAHSYNRITRSWNVANVKAYIDGLASGEVVSESETLSASDIFNDYVITALRTAKGIDLDYLHSNHPEKMVGYMEHQAQSFLATDKLEIKDRHLKLTHNGIFISDEIMEALIVV